MELKIEILMALDLYTLKWMALTDLLNARNRTFHKPIIDRFMHQSARRTCANFTLIESEHCKAFKRFVEELPTLESLAEASQDQELALWSGLGYYSRARNLHACAKMCVERHAADLPSSLDDLAALPGIGRSTAAAILAQAHGQAHAILDGNVRRVLARHHGVHGWPGQARVQTELWRLSEAHLPQSRLADYTQAQMDLGATVCSRAKPACVICPTWAAILEERR